ncbi:hypothetical protein BDV11DRAFT_27013 [Aspergillus similis]
MYHPFHSQWMLNRGRINVHREDEVLPSARIISCNKIEKENISYRPAISHHRHNYSFAGRVYFCQQRITGADMYVLRDSFDLQGLRGTLQFPSQPIIGTDEHFESRPSRSMITITDRGDHRRVAEAVRYRKIPKFETIRASVYSFLSRTTEWRWSFN